MTTDRAYELACLDIEICLKIWDTNEVERFRLAEAAYQRAVEIRDTYFPDKPQKTQHEQH